MHGFLIAVKKFRSWADDYPEEKRSGEWECDYSNWRELQESFETFIGEKQGSSLLQVEIDDLIYILARDNEVQYLIRFLFENIPLMEFLIPHLLASEESDAKWQLAKWLGHSRLDFALSEETLLSLIVDSNEYVSRLALQALGQIKSSHAEKYCQIAWDTNHEYQRIMALWVLKEINSPLLSKYLNFAFEDNRKYIVQNAHEIQNLN